ncbi:beta-L-arabinofuranosidase domain-containing protein [Butyrivibrio sp. MC2021]|uniref:beta-L-arabinofuranosidase domain-containing protein n=1 Tax=Butyrivibrio sp. MC2021 TaxID=1408306 RepID=UPI000684AB94|nr:beta-L-arabinofuranosidase domain-containing protein [Butyrivibrio sp. MC2021]
MKNDWIDDGFFRAKVTDKYYEEAFLTEIKNLLFLDADRLLAGFRETAGRIAKMDEDEISLFMKKKERYGGMWEDGLIGGHTMGHYITALSQGFAYPGIPKELKDKVGERLDYIIDSLYECQEKIEGTGEEGFIFAATLPTEDFRKNPTLQFDNVEKGLGEIFTQAWVPWYTMHKIVSGLNSAYRFAGNEKALKVDNMLGLWIAKRCESWNEEVRKTVLGIEYGGMNDCLYELYVINKELSQKGSPLALEYPERILAAAHSFDEEPLFEKVLQGGDNLFDNVHANTTIPKFLGALAGYEADRSRDRYLEYAKAFFDNVVQRHTYITGGNSEDEHFGPDNILDKERTNVNNETCNTYNMLKLARRLFAVTGEKRYLDYAANTFINAIVASFNHDTGFTTYFQPMATGYQKVFNTLEGNFWCCTGTGYENFTKLQRGIYFKSGKTLLIGLYLASEYCSDEYRISMACDFAVSDKVKLVITPFEGKKVSDDLYLRKPQWLKGKPQICLNGFETEVKDVEGFFVISSETIENGAEILLTLPMGITAHNLQDGENTYGFCYGPFVLSARLGNTKIKETSHGVAVSVAAVKSVESDVLKVLNEKSVRDYIEKIDQYLVKRDDAMEFHMSGVSMPLTFTTHYNQYKESYGIYWKFTVD